MKNFALPRALVALLPLLACNDEGLIGSERCLGKNTRCVVPRDDQILNELAGNLTMMSSQTAREARRAWSFDLRCENTCDSVQLIDDGSGGVWVLYPTYQHVSYKHIDKQAQVIAEGENERMVDYPFGIAGASRSWPLRDGGFVFSTTSFDGKHGDVHPPYRNRIVRVNDDGVTLVDAGQVSSDGVGGLAALGAQPGFDVVPSGDGFITVSLAPSISRVREFDGDGKTLWQQVALPKAAEANLGLAPLASGFAMLIGPRATNTGFFSNADTRGMVWFDADGNITTQMNWISGWQQRPPILLGLSEDRVALAGVVTGGNSKMQSEDLCVMRLARDGSRTGHCVLGDTAINHILGGVASDAEETVYVSSVAGTRDDAHGLLCALPDTGEGICYKAPEGIFPTRLSVSEPGVVYTITEQELVKLELP